MKPENWSKLDMTEKRKIAEDLLQSRRGSYLISQALEVAIYNMKKEKHPAESNIEDMEILQEFLSDYHMFMNLKAEFKNACKGCENMESSMLKIATEGRKYNIGLFLICKNPSDVQPKLLSQCREIIPLGDRYLLSTLPIVNQIISGGS